MSTTTTRRRVTERRRLTPAQERELRELARKPQNTFGKARVRVQNNLVFFGFARYVDEEDEYGYQQLCAITDAGRDWLKGSK